VNTIELRPVTDRDLLLAIDDIYRTTMMRHQAGELLGCARQTATALRVSPAREVVEGYYSSSAALAEDFSLVRALQDVSGSRSAEVESLPAFARLAAVLGSPLYGRPVEDDSLLPRRADSLALVMMELPATEWTIATIASRARARALADDDCSLVGLAARTGDLVMLTALAESAVLERYRSLGREPVPRYVWRVSDDLAHAAARFVAHFHALFGDTYPAIGPESTEAYWLASRGKSPAGRCLWLGTDPARPGASHYHWAVAYPKMTRLPRLLDRLMRRERGFRVVEFWSEEVWTTQRYQVRADEDVCAELERSRW